MPLPDDIEQAFKTLEVKLESIQRGNLRASKALNNLRTLVLRQHNDVIKATRTLERRIERIEDRLSIPHTIEPEPSPRALPDPP